MKFTSAKAKNIFGMGQALRKGIPQVRPVRGEYFTFGRGGYLGDKPLKKACRACAIGTAIIGAKLSLNKTGLQIHISFADLLDEAFPDGQMLCPTNSYSHTTPYPYSPARLMEHLFEDHLWSRLKVAKYMEKEALKIEQEEKAKNVN